MKLIHKIGTVGLCALILALPACDGGGEASKDKSKGGEKAAEDTAGKTPEVQQKPESIEDRVKKGVDRAIRYLRGAQDPKSGRVAFMAPYNVKMSHPGITAMALQVYLRSHRGYNMEDDPFVRNAAEWLASLQKEDGAIYERDSANYVTSVSLVALSEADEERFRPVIEKARDWMVRLQAREDTGYRPGDRFYGGVGYGGDERPDLSNHQFALEAATASKLPADHPFWKRSLKFLERNQNWSETNDQVFKDKEGNEVRPGNDGGAMYLPGDSKAGLEIKPDGTRVFRSYGSMSYALLKSYLFCKLDKRDSRVRAVRRWCIENFELDYHPGFQKGEQGNEQYQGLFYYYYSMARALSVFGERVLEKESGAKHDWAQELAEKLLSLQNPDDGSFVNGRSQRWQEGSGVLCTCYAALALEECLKMLNSK